MEPIHNRTRNSWISNRKVAGESGPTLVHSLLKRQLSSKKALEVFEEIDNRGPDTPFAQAVLDALEVFTSVRQHIQPAVPASGPLVVVANHPFGAVEGLVLLEYLLQARQDVKLIATSLLSIFDDLAEHCIFANPFASRRASKENIKPLRQAIRWVSRGGVLALFPAGEVAHLGLRTRSITESDWSTSLGFIVRQSKATVLPIHFDGANGPLFQLAGLIHPRVRTALLAREIFNKRGTNIPISVGAPISFHKLQSFADDAAMTRYLRQRTLLLKGVAVPKAAKSRQKTSSKALHPIVEPVSPRLLTAEVESLPPDQRLCRHRDLATYIARARQIPHLLNEIGRLRELSFRAAGEGAGERIDLDRFDSRYFHLFVWNHAVDEVVGAYRLGLTDKLVNENGRMDLYSATLFKMKPALEKRLNPALELGRSFVRPEYQKAPLPLMLLWKGIGHFVVKYPYYKYLFGPVSISAKYQTASLQLMIAFLEANRTEAESAKLVRPRNGIRITPTSGWDPRKIVSVARNIADLSSMVSDVEATRMGVPILLEQYLKLGGEVLAFNLDARFSNCTDGLVLVDLTKANRTTLNRYMGKDGAGQFLAYHGQEQGETSRRQTYSREPVPWSTEVRVTSQPEPTE